MGTQDSFLPIIKQRVIDMLKLEGKTQKEMAAALDITPEHLSRCLKKGRISKPWLIAIANYLDVTEESLTDESKSITRASRVKSAFDQFIERYPDAIPGAVRKELYLRCLDQLDYDPEIINHIYEIRDHGADYDSQRILINDALEHIDDYVQMKFSQLVENIRKEMS